MKVYNPKTKKAQDLFETLIPVFTVGYTGINNKGCAVYINVSAKNEEVAKDIAIANKEFMKYIHNKKTFNKKYLHVFKPSGNYVIGSIEYYEGDPRL